MEFCFQTYMASQKVGILKVDSNCHFQFNYTLPWLNYKDSFPISLSMPLRRKVYTGKKINNFFYQVLGVLPEKGLGVQELIRKLKFECPGALSFYDEHSAPEEGKGQYSVISQNTFLSLMSSKTVDDGIVKFNKFKQKVISIVTHQGNLYVPNGQSPGMYFLKTESDYFEGIVENEYVCCSLAKKVGLRTGGVKIQRYEGQNYLLMERTDRSFDKEQLQVIHQESVAQSLGITHHSREQNYTYINLFKFTQKYSFYPARDKLQILRLMCFNLIIGYTEFDLEDIFVDIGSESVALSKMSGLISTASYASYFQHYKMSIKGVKELKNLTVEKLRALCQDNAISYKFFIKEILNMTNRVSSEFTHIQNKLLTDATVNQSFLAMLSQTIRSNCDYIQSWDI